MTLPSLAQRSAKYPQPHTQYHVVNILSLGRTWAIVPTFGARFASRTDFMTTTKILCAVVVSIGLSGSETWADCNISDSKIEEAILQKPEFLDPNNRQMVRDLRSLRDSAFVLWSYGRIEDCERLMGNIRELVASPSMGSLGGSDEDEVEQQDIAREPLVRRGGATLGRRGDANAKPLIRIDEMAPGLRADEIIGAEVRTSDDKIVGEVRNIVFGTKDRRDYAIVASGGFFVPGKTV